MRSDNKTSSLMQRPASWHDNYVIITGPTASGKSALALALAEAAPGVIINADSMQLYRDLRVLTARPSLQDEARAPHQLYGVLDGAERASVAAWLDLLRDVVAQCRVDGVLPILVGGTGMYINAALHGIAPIPDVPTVIHKACAERHSAIGGVAFRAELAELDPVLAARLFDGDSQRLVRAMGVVKATGRPLSEWQQDPHAGQLPGKALCVAVLPERDDLYQRIDQRFDAMFASGAFDEVIALGARNLDPGLPVMKALGVRELLAHHQGEMTRELAIELAKRDSRRYAKRQITWLRNNFKPKLIVNEKFSESLLKKIFANLLKSG